MNFGSRLFLGSRSRHIHKLPSVHDIRLLNGHIGKELLPKATMAVYPNALTVGEGDSLTVRVSWSGIVKGSPRDFVAVYCKPPAGPEGGGNGVGYFGNYLDALNVPKRMAAAGTGQLTFDSLIRMRCEYEFKYIRVQSSNKKGAALKLQVVAETGRLRDAALEKPQHGHLSLGDTPSEMWVSWVSGGNVPHPVVQFGTSPSSLGQSTTGLTVTYSAKDMCHAPANISAEMYARHPGFMHHVKLSGLQGCTTYFYRYGHARTGWSTVRSFHTSHACAASESKFIFLADMGIGDAPSAVTTAQSVFQDVEEGLASFVVHGGDLSYALGSTWKWDVWLHMIEPIASRVPYQVVVGNHEYVYATGGDKDPSHFAGLDHKSWKPSFGNQHADSFGECAVPVVNYFRAPHSPRSNGVFWYAFDHGVVRVVVISTDHSWLPGSPQHTWLQEELRRTRHAAGGESRWIVVMGHRPSYISQGGEAAENKMAVHQRTALDPLFEESRVNLALWGHYHSYERTCAVVSGKCQTQGTVHITAGTAGANLERGAFGATGNFSVMGLNGWGYLRVHAQLASLRVQFVLNLNRAVYDEVILSPWPAPPANQ